MSQYAPEHLVTVLLDQVGAMRGLCSTHHELDHARPLGRNLIHLACIVSIPGARGSSLLHGTSGMDQCQKLKRCSNSDRITECSDNGEKGKVMLLHEG